MYQNKEVTEYLIIVETRSGKAMKMAIWMFFFGGGGGALKYMKLLLHFILFYFLAEEFNLKCTL